MCKTVSLKYSKITAELVKAYDDLAIFVNSDKCHILLVTLERGLTMILHPTADKLTNEILEEAAKYRVKNNVEPLDLLGYKKFLETGERLTFEQQYFARRKQLDILALDIFIRKSTESIPLLEEVIFQICNEYSWALPAHMPIRDRCYSEEGREIIDLFAQRKLLKALLKLARLLAINSLTLLNSEFPKKLIAVSLLHSRSKTGIGNV